MSDGRSGGCDSLIDQMARALWELKESRAAARAPTGTYRLRPFRHAAQQTRWRYRQRAREIIQTMAEVQR